MCNSQQVKVEQSFLMSHVQKVFNPRIFYCLLNVLQACVIETTTLGGTVKNSQSVVDTKIFYEQLYQPLVKFLPLDLLTL